MAMNGSLDPVAPRVNRVKPISKVEIGIYTSISI